MAHSFKREFGQEFILYISGDTEEYARVQESNFYRGMLKQLRKVSDSDAIIDQIDYLLTSSKEGRFLTLEDLKQSMSALGGELYLNIELLEEKLYALKLERDQLNSKRKEEYDEIQKEADLIEEKTRKNV